MNKVIVAYIFLLMAFSQCDSLFFVDGIAAVTKAVKHSFNKITLFLMPRQKPTPIVRPKVPPSTRKPTVIRIASTKQIKRTTTVPKPKHISKNIKDLIQEQSKRYKDIAAAILMTNDDDIVDYKLSAQNNEDLQVEGLSDESKNVDYEYELEVEGLSSEDDFM